MQHPTALCPQGRNKVQVLAVEISSAWTSFLQEGHCLPPSPGEMAWQSWNRPLDSPCSPDGQSMGWALNCLEKSVWWCNTCWCPFFQCITLSWSPAPSQLMGNCSFGVQSLVWAAVQSAAHLGLLVWQSQAPTPQLWVAGVSSSQGETGAALVPAECYSTVCFA